MAYEDPALDPSSEEAPRSAVWRWVRAAQRRVWIALFFDGREAALDDGVAPHRGVLSALWAGLTNPVVSMLLLAVAVLGTAAAQTDLRGEGAVLGWIARRMAGSDEWFGPYFRWVDGGEGFRPPLVMWMAAGCGKLFGFSDVVVVLIPSVLFGVASVVTTCAIAHRAFVLPTAATAGMILATTVSFIMCVANLGTGVAFIFAFLLALWGGQSLLTAEPTPWWKPRVGYWIAIGLAVGLGLMADGVLVLLALPVLVAAFLLAGRWGLALSPGWLVAVLAAGLVAAPWHGHMARTYGQEFLGPYLERLWAPWRGTGAPAAAAWDFYTRQMLTYYWPWLLPAAGGLYALGRGIRARWRKDALLVTWIVVYAILICLLRVRAEALLVSLLAAFALVGAEVINGTEAESFWRRVALPKAGVASVAVAIVLAVTGSVLVQPQMPELQKAGKELRQAMKEGAPTIFVTDDLSAHERYMVLFRADVADASALMELRRNQPAQLRFGDIVVATRASTPDLEQANLPLAPVAKGRMLSIYRLTPGATARSTAAGAKPTFAIPTFFVDTGLSSPESTPSTNIPFAEPGTGLKLIGPVVKP